MHFKSLHFHFISITTTAQEYDTSTGKLIQVLNWFTCWGVTLFHFLFNLCTFLCQDIRSAISLPVFRHQL